MSIHRIYAIILRNLFTFRTNYDRWIDAFYWPIMDLVLWGITSAYISSFSPEFANIVITIVSGLTFWFIVTRSQYETNVALLEDIWSRNLINIFVSPLTVTEWIIGVLAIGVIKAGSTFIFATIVAFLLYKVNVFAYGFYLIPFILLLLMTGWWVSFMITASILRFGTRLQTFAWTLVVLLAPFSGIFYPVSVLPSWAQKVSTYLPTSYIFSGIREVIKTGKYDPSNLLISLLLNLIYLLVGALLLFVSYKSMIRRGMSKVY